MEITKFPPVGHAEVHPECELRMAHDSSLHYLFFIAYKHATICSFVHYRK
jgi:hypothetical protein